MDLTFQVPMQYCSLQHQTLLLSPVTSTAGYCFCFGSVPSFFLELFLHWSPVAYWVPTDLRSFSFSIHLSPFNLTTDDFQILSNKWTQSYPKSLENCKTLMAPKITQCHVISTFGDVVELTNSGFTHFTMDSP